MAADERNDERMTHHFHFDTDRTDPNTAVIRAVAALEDTDPTELGRLYECIDHVIDLIFSEPPVRDANVRISFDYEGYRIAIEQDGTAMFVKR